MIFSSRHFIALGQAVEAGSKYGVGHNYQVEIYVADSPQEGAWRERVDAVLRRIDHAHLGLDQSLGFVPTTSALARWLAEELLRAGFKGLVGVRLECGDGLVTTYLVHPLDDKLAELDVFVSG
ncbi:MAG: hypothetical protein HC902_12745 [Calothrix sp. SM1_5_4]|nr:hypothetical protein [Calothrix sp. SM1_5_4]